MSTSIIEPGARLAGRYRLEDRVREAGGSTLWRAIDEILARAVAVRTFDPEFPRIASVVTAARAASRLTDPRLTQVFDADDSGEQAYVVSEWVTGETLEEMITAHGPLEPGRAATLLCEAAEAIAAAHAAGLSHLRLTLRDLLWTTGGTVKLLGVAVDAELAAITCEDPALVDARGLGHMLYAALTGHWPGESQSVLPAPPMAGPQICAPRQVKAGVPYALDALVCRVLDLQANGAAGQEPIASPAALAQALTGVPRTPLPLFAGLNPGPPPSIIPRQPRENPPTGRAGGPTGGPPPRSRGAHGPAANPSVPGPGGAGRNGPNHNHGGPGQAAPNHAAQDNRGGRGRGGRVPSAPGHTGGPAPAHNPAHQGRQQAAFQSVGGADATTQQAGQPSTGSHRGGPGPAGRHGSGRPVNRPLVAVAAAVATVIVGIGAWQLTKDSEEPGKGGVTGTQSPAASPTRTEGKLAVSGAEGFDASPSDHPDSKSAVTGPLAVDTSNSTSWETQGYNTPDYGRYKKGLGVLLDMGETVTVSRLKVTMPPGSGGVLELRVGDQKDLGSLNRVAKKEGLTGSFELSAGKVAKGRYVLLWVTELPSASPRYKAKIANVVVFGPEG